MRFLPEPATCHNVQKFVTPLVIHTMVAVPGFAEVLSIFQVSSKLPVIACTCIPLKTRLSFLFVQPTVIVMVSVFSATTIDAAEIFAFVGTRVTIPTPDLNLQLLGAVKINVTLVALAKSLFALSAIVIFPNVVHHEPYAELAALSAETFVPPFATVTTTVK